MGDSVLLLDGNNRSALVVARSLGRRGISVDVASDCHPCLAGCSRYAHQKLICPSPAYNPIEYAQWLEEICSDGKYKLILPLSDISTVLLASAKVGSSTHKPVSSPDSLNAVLDKSNLTRLAQEFGIPVPKTWDLGEDGLKSADTGVEFPVIVKSKRSFEQVDDRWVEGAVKLARNHTELIDAYRQIAAPMIQEYIPGWGEGVFILCNHGKVQASFAHKRLRETPPGGGISTLRESTVVDPGLLSAIRVLLERLEWHGPAMFEFRRDSRDGACKLIEVNPRFWGSLHLAIVSGLDFPWLVYRMATEEDFESYPDYQTGIRSRWLLGDFNRLLLVMSKRQNIAAEFLSFIKFHIGTYLEVESLADPKPALYEYQSYGRDLLKTMLTKFRNWNETHQ